MHSEGILSIQRQMSKYTEGLVSILKETDIDSGELMFVRRDWCTNLGSCAN